MLTEPFRFLTIGTFAIRASGRILATTGAFRIPTSGSRGDGGSLSGSSRKQTVEHRGLIEIGGITDCGSGGIRGTPDGRWSRTVRPRERRPCAGSGVRVGRLRRRPPTRRRVPRIRCDRTEIQVGIALLFTLAAFENYTLLKMLSVWPESMTW